MPNMYDKSGASLDEAMKVGYKCTMPDCAPKHLLRICRELGPEYHLASMNIFPGGPKDCVVHRVLGDGIDVEIYGPTSKRGRYNVALWEQYGCHNVEERLDVPRSGIGRCVEELIAGVGDLVKGSSEVNSRNTV